MPGFIDCRHRFYAEIIFETLCIFKLHRSSLQWRHNGRDRVSNHQPHDCLLNRLFRHGSKKTSKLRVTGLCAGNSLGTGEFTAQMASNAENVSIWWRHHVLRLAMQIPFSYIGYYIEYTYVYKTLHTWLNAYTCTHALPQYLAFCVFKFIRTTLFMPRWFSLSFNKIWESEQNDDASVIKSINIFAPLFRPKVKRHVFTFIRR